MQFNEVECLKDAGYSQEEIDIFLKEKKEDNDIKFNNDTGCGCLNKCISNLPKKLPLIEKIEFIPEPDKYFIRFNYEGNKLLIKTPRIYVPFGIDSYYKNWSINFELKNKDCEGIKLFKEFLFNFEEQIINKLKIKRSELNTQFKIHKKFNMEFYGRIKNMNSKCMCVIEDKRKLSENKFVNVYKFPKQVFVKAEMTTDGIWKLNNMYCYKYVINKLTLVD